MGAFYFTLILVWSSAFFATNKADIAPMIRDLVRYFGNRNKIYTYTCWEKDLQANFEKRLEKEFLHSKINLSQITDVKNNFIFVDLSCETKQLLEKAKSKNVFTHSEFWLLLQDSSSKFTLENFHFPIKSNVYLIEETPYNYYTIKSVYKPSRNYYGLVETTVGRWTKSDGYNEIYNTLEQKKHRKTFREIIKICYVLKDAKTVAHLNDYQYDVLTDTMTKLSYALLESLLLIVNATKNETFGHLRGKDSIDAIIRDLKNGICDIGGTPLELLSQRIDEMTVLGKVAAIENKFIFRATPHSYISNVFTLPFDSYVWYSCFGLMVIIFLAAYIVVYWEWTDPIFKRFLSPRFCLRPNPVDIFLMEVGSAAQQGFESEPRSNSGRIVFIFTLISLMFLYTSFSASIVALLQSTTEGLNTLEKLFESRIPVGFKDNISMDYFYDLKYENKSREFQNKIRKPTFLSIDEGLNKVQKDFFAFYADTSEVYKYVNDWFLESEKCSLREIPIKATYMNHWLFAKKNTEFTDMFRTGMNRIDETGIRSREYKRLFTARPNCDSVGGNFESVGLADSYGAFLVMVVGLILSVLLFLMEKMWIKYQLRYHVDEILRRNLDIFKTS